MHGMRAWGYVRTADDKDVPAKVLLDPGSDHLNFIGEAFLNANPQIVREKSAVQMKVSYAGTTDYTTTKGTAAIMLTLPTLYTKEQAVITYHVLPTQENIIVGLPTIRRHFTQATIAVLMQETHSSDADQTSIAHMTTALDPGGTLANLISPTVETARRKEIELLQARGHKITEAELAPDATPEDDIVADMEIFPSGYNSPEAYAQRVKEYTNTYASGELYPLGKISMSATMSSSGAEKVLLFMIFSAQNRLGNKITQA
jgi:hypothetical protein